MSSLFSRDSLLTLLRAYQPNAGERSLVVERLIDFVKTDPRCAERSNQYGHLTGSAFVVNESKTKALLLHHRKLNRWLQPGGHADGEFDLLSVALREAKEESGLSRVTPVSSDIFDVDIHEIPSFKDTPAHLHFDVRFLLRADEDEPLVHNEESNQVAWIEFEQIARFTEEKSVLRMVRALIGNSCLC